MTLLIETDRSLPLVQLAVSVQTGASFDPVGKEGLTRLTSRLMRRTALGWNPEVIDEHLDTLGASLGSDVGASSSGFAGSVISRSWQSYVELLQGVLLEPGLDPQELQRLKRETLDEILEMKDNDRALARSWFRQALFTTHPYARTSVGSPKSLEAITHGDVVEHYRRTLVASNLIFALAGDVDESTARALSDRIEGALADVPPPEQRLEEPTAPGGRRLLIVDKPERSQTQIIMGGLGSHPSDADHTALIVANTVFGGTFTARLTQEVRAKRGWSYGAYSSLPYDRKRQAFSMWTFPAATDAAACLKLQFEMLEQWVDDGITAEELDWAKNYLIRSNVFNIDTAAKRMSLLLDEQVYDLPTNYYSGYPARVRDVTLAQVNEALRRRISLDDVIVTVVGTNSEIGDALAQAIPNLGHRAVVSYEDEPRNPWA